MSGGLQSWVVSKLRENLSHYGEASRDVEIETVGPAGLRVRRPNMPDGLVYCASLQDSTDFDVADLNSVRRDLPGVHFVAVVPTRISHSAYASASELGVCVEGFGELTPAVLRTNNLALHMEREHAFVSSRLQAWRIVSSFKRTGHRSYLINRTNGRPISIIAIDHYELTADAVYEAALSYESMNADAIVATNPSARGVSEESVSAAQSSGMRVVHFRNLYADLRDLWR